ncbi:TolC family protein [Sulfurimonas sp.]
MKLYILLLLPMWLFSESLDVLIENAKNSHNSLKTIEQRVSAIDDEYQVSRNFADPSISLSMSDIQFDDPTKRDLEPMQFTSINFKQKIPYFGKRDAVSKKIDAKKQKISLTLDETKVKLVKAIKISAYSIWQIEQELKIINEYINLTKQNIELYSAYGSNDTSSHMSIMSAEMTLSELRIKESRLKSSLVGLYERLSYLSAMEVKSVELDMDVNTPKDVSFYTSTKGANLTYKIKETTLSEANEDIKVKELDSYIDPVVQVGYYHRDAFKDYANIGIAFSLPIYGTQDSKAEISRKLALAFKSEVVDADNSIKAQIIQTHAKLLSAYKIYDIIQNQSMPQIEHMFELSSSSIKNGDELFLYINLLEKKLTLDEKSIGIVAVYYKTEATLDALIGEMK